MFSSSAVAALGNKRIRTSHRLLSKQKRQSKTNHTTTHPNLHQALNFQLPPVYEKRGRVRSFVYSPHVTHCIWHRKTTVYSLAIASWNALLGVSTVHSPLFSCKIVGNEHLHLQAAILVSNVPSLACEYQIYRRWYTIKKCIRSRQMFSKRSKVFFLRQQHEWRTSKKYYFDHLASKSLLAKVKNKFLFV